MGVRTRAPSPTSLHKGAMPMASDTNAPALIAYSVRQREGASDVWTRIGAVFPHSQGEGFNLMLDALPMSRKIVVMPPKPKETE